MHQQADLVKLRFKQRCLEDSFVDPDESAHVRARFERRGAMYRKAAQIGRAEVAEEIEEALRFTREEVASQTRHLDCSRRPQFYVYFRIDLSLDEMRKIWPYFDNSYLLF